VTNLYDISLLVVHILIHLIFDNIVLLPRVKLHQEVFRARISRYLGSVKAVRVQIIFLTCGGANVGLSATMAGGVFWVRIHVNC
jgi:hypothetical protein